MDALQVAAIAAAAGSAALGVTTGIKLIPDFISTRRLVRSLAEKDDPSTGDLIVAGVRGAGRPKGRLRSSNVAGMVAGAMRLRSGGYMRAYSVRPKATMLGQGPTPTWT